MLPADLRALLEQQFPEADGPGGVVGVVRPGHDLMVESRGMADLEQGVPVGPRTVFHLASLSKQVTAYAIALLADDGVLGLADRVVDHLPWMPFPEITIEQLIRHTSGLRDQWQLLEAASWRMEDVITTDDVVRLIRRQRGLNFEPGTWQAYSNTGYTLLALIVEHLSGSTLQDFCASRIFEPLGMRDTRFVTDHQELVPNRATSYTRGGEGYRRIGLSYATVGATNLSSTVLDLARWLIAADGFRERRAGVERAPDDAAETYGLGVRVGTHGSLTKIYHAGADAGFRAHFAAVPETGVAVIALSNLAQARPADLCESVLSCALGAPEPRVVSVAPGSAARLAGRYLDPRQHVVVDVAERDGSLLLDTRFGPAALEPVAEGRYEGDGVVAEVRDGRFLVADDPVRAPHEWLRFGDAAIHLPLQRFAGRFFSDELDTSIRIEWDDALWLVRPRAPRTRLEAVAEGVFFADDPRSTESTRVTLVFSPDAESLTYSTYGAQNLGFERIRLQATPAPLPLERPGTAVGGAMPRRPGGRWSQSGQPRRF